MSVKKLLVGVAAAPVALAMITPPPAQAWAQGGRDGNGGDHAWMKIDRAEVSQASRACTRVFGYGYPGFRPCDQMAPHFVNLRWSKPNANGYWVEWYVKTNAIRSGTW